MPLKIIHQDISTVKCDAIVNPTDCFYSGGGGADYAIHTAAGEEMDRACAKLPPLDYAETHVTPGFKLPCKNVIHTMGPIWENGLMNEPALLRSCYMNSLICAKKLGARSVAFPLISSGAFGFPKDRVLRIAIQAIADYLQIDDGDMEVSICVIDREAFSLSKEVALNEFLDDRNYFSYVNHQLELHDKDAAGRSKSDASAADELRPVPKLSAAAPDISKPHQKPSRPRPKAARSDEEKSAFQICEESLPDNHLAGLSVRYSLCTPSIASAAFSPVPAEKPDLSDIPLSEWISRQDDSFPVMLMKLIDKKGMDDVECYRNANISKNVFYNIRNRENYKPKKETVIAFAISLRLSLEETCELLKSAGFALSRSRLFDLIIEFYITRGVYNIYEINEALYKYDQVCLGCSSD